MSKIDHIVIWLIITIAVVANAAGYLWQLYPRFWWFDKAIYVYTTFTLTLIVGVFLYGIVLTGARCPFLLILLLTTVELGLEALWESGEWIFDLLVPGNAIRGKHDTMIDMVTDAAGALVAGLLTVRIRAAEN